MPNYNVKINLGVLKAVYSSEDDSFSVILKFVYFNVSLKNDLMNCFSLDMSHIISGTEFTDS